MACSKHLGIPRLLLCCFAVLSALCVIVYCITTSVLQRKQSTKIRTQKGGSKSLLSTRDDNGPSSSSSSSSLRNTRQLQPEPTWIFSDQPSLDWLHNVTRTSNCADASKAPVRSANTVLDEELLRKFYIAGKLMGEVAYDRSLIRNLAEYQKVYDRFYAWNDGINDVTLTTKVEGTCYAAFRATDPYNFADVVLQNLKVQALMIPGSNCYVRGGYYDAYFTRYKDEFEQRVQECVDSCENGQCPLVFTGMSQGAGPSVVASIVWRDLDPLIITFGGAKVIYRISPEDNSICTDVNPRRHFRFVLTDRVFQLIDRVPFLWAFYADHVGHEIQFDDEHFCYLGINPRIDRDPLRYNLIVHSPYNYDAKVRKIYESVCLPVASRGWIDGHWCAEDDDCESRLCYRNNCHPGFDVQERCGRDKECKSGICNENLERCAPASGLMENDMQCIDHEDCESGRCVRNSIIPFTGSSCMAQMEPGSKCTEDADCLSGVCGGILFQKRCWPEDDPNIGK